MSVRAITLAVAATLVLAPAGRALQVTLSVTVLRSSEPGTSNGFGRSLTVADFDGDGFDDLVAMEPGATEDGQLAAGRGWILRGPGFAPMAEFEARGPEESEHLGSGGCWTGDVNADGAVDILVGCYEYPVEGQLYVGRAHVFLGPDYSIDIVLQEPVPAGGAWFGWRPLLVDVDEDGRDDVLVAAARAEVRLPDGTSLEGAGKVYYWNALSLFDPAGLKTPSVIADPEPLQGGAFGFAMTTSNVNDRPPPDLLVSNQKHACCPLMTGQVYVLDGLGPVVLDSAGLGVLPGTMGLGNEIDLADVTGDGIDDLVVGANSSNLPGCDDGGRVIVMEGPTFDRIAFALESPYACTGSYWIFGGHNLVIDVDRDGDLEIVSQDPVQNLSSFDLVEVFWGPDYDTFESLGDEFAPGHLVGLGADMVSGDFDGDGFDELAISATEGNGSGSVYVYDVQTLTAGLDEISVSAGGDVTFALRMAPEDSGKGYVAGLSVSGSTPGIVLGPGSYVPLNPDAVTTAGISLLASPLLDGFLGRLDAAAAATMELHFPPGFSAILIGHTLTVAAVVVEPDGRFGAGSSAAAVLLAP